MILYLSGPILSRPATYKQEFADAQKRMEKLGHIVLNPAVLPLGLKQDRYMPICIAMLDAAEAIVMLADWDQSAGAKIEHDYAQYQGKLIIYDTK